MGIMRKYLIHIKDVAKNLPRNTLYKFVQLLGDRYDMVAISQRKAENNFFSTEVSEIEKILNGRKLNVFDVGARGGIEYGLKKYNHLLNITMVEPDTEALFEKSKGINVVRKLIGGQEGVGLLNVCKKGGVSSVLEPTGKFLDYYTSGNIKRFEVVNKISFPMTTIESAIKETHQENQLDYLKLDTQGSEIEILEGLGKIRPIIIKTEISFVPLYKDAAIFFNLGKVLYDMGYILFHTSYRGKSAPAKHKSDKPFNETIIPLHGDAWFMPDWTRSEGIEMIKGREKQYKALMIMFGMKDIQKYALIQMENV